MGVAIRIRTKTLSDDLSGEQRMPSVYSAKRFRVACAVVLALATALPARPAAATSRIKDLANIEGVRQNQLVGYGLVVGLNGTGDTLNNIPFTKQSLQAMLERMGVNIRGATIRTGNVAAVMVTGNLPPFGTQGTRMDVTVSSLGDAKDLRGGTLLVTPLLGADGNVYSVAQGSVAINGFQAEGEAAKVVRGVPTVGRIVNGAIIEREIEFALNRLPNVRLALRNADFTTAKRIAAAVNDYLGAKSAEPIDPSTVQLTIPAEFKGNVVAFLTEIEQLQVEPDLAAKIIIDERSGIIVMGRDVRVATVAVAQGNLTVTISESPQVSQPNALSRGRTVVTPNSRVGVTEDGKKFALVKDGVSLQQLVDGLNGLGIGPRDLIGILQAIKAAGAIEADIEVM
jgi:flagellar P-ring protein FlgI